MTYYYTVGVRAKISMVVVIYGIVDLVYGVGDSFGYVHQADPIFTCNEIH